MTRCRFAFCGFLFLWGLNPGRAGTLAQFRTVFGDIEVELYDQDKPVTVQNFIRYTQNGLYQDGFAHRLEPGFVIQGGDSTITNRGTADWVRVPIPTYPPITNEFGVGRKFSNVYGTLAMAKVLGDTNSATSQWFFNLTNNAFLDAPDTNHLFVVFGHVVRGTNILNTFNKFKYWSYYSTPPQKTNVVLYQYFVPPFDELPLLHPAIEETNIVFVDISLLQVTVTAAGGARQISWNSATGLTNIVEFTTNLPPVWKTLIVTNGNGSRFTVTDTTATNAFRFYRVRVRY